MVLLHTKGVTQSHSLYLYLLKLKSKLEFVSVHKFSLEKWTNLWASCISVFNIWLSMATTWSLSIPKSVLFTWINKAWVICSLNDLITHIISCSMMD